MFPLPSATAEELGGVLWQYPTGGRIVGPPVITDESTVIAVSEDRYLYSLSAEGTLLWRSDLGFRPAFGAALGPDGSFYVVSRIGTLKALNPRGEELWRADILGPPAGPPHPTTDGTVVIRNLDGVVSAWSHNGFLRWRKNSERPSASGDLMVSEDGIILLPGASGHLSAWDLFGREQWRFLTAGDPGTPFPALEETLGGTSYGTAFLLDRNGKMLWNLSWQEPVEVLYSAEGAKYLCTGASTLRCVSPEGTELWQSSSGAGVSAAAGYGNGLLVLGERGVELYSAQGEKTTIISHDFGPGFWAARPSALVVHGGENWHITCLNPALFLFPGDSWNWKVGKAGIPSSADYSNSTDYRYLLSVAQGQDENAQKKILEEFRDLYQLGPPKTIPPYAEEILRLIASGAVTRPVYAGKHLLNDFPLRRIEALELLACYGNLNTPTHLLSLLALEWDSHVTAKIIETLGRLGCDGDGRVAKGILKALRRTPRFDVVVPQASMDALEAILRYNGRLTSEDAAEACLYVYRGDYPRELRLQASGILMKMEELPGPF
ncbi:MAG: PQQ-binding-like beta-propeller repeat protein [Spirochaetales bacterium]|nr:PQQ-binding-like beta-propeller repeat protein [Spirochaetales bacterium]